MKLAILAMVVISTAAQLNVVDKIGKDAVSKLKDTRPDRNIKVKITGEVKTKIEDSKAVDAVNFAGKAIKTKLVDFDVDNDLGKAELDFTDNDDIENRFGMQTMSKIVNGVCAPLQDMIGVDYEEVQETAELELEKLRLTLSADNQYRYFTLGSVAASLPLTSVYNCSCPVVIFMHGFTDNPTKHNFQAVNEAFQKIGNFNILALDASPLIRKLYLRSSTYVRLIGERLGETLAVLIKAGQKQKDIHLVGHSLGAHIAGFTGKTFHDLTGTLVGRISGLDPAGPCFSNVDDDLRLKSTDAKFVDVIHTDAGVYGLSEPVGHVDYFPNGGERQPSCFLNSCSHSRVVDLFAESVVRPNEFLARACKDWEEFEQGNCKGDVSWMGYKSKPGTTGLYYLRTAKEAPYGLGTLGLTPKNHS